MKQAFLKRGKRDILEAPNYAQKRPMIRHQVYFDTLGSMREDSASWRSVFAGLSVLRLIDSCVESGASIDPTNWAQLHSVRTALENVNEGDPIRGVLTTILDEATRRAAIDEVVCGSLLAYGRALDYEASWGLATDVFSTVAKLARPEKSPKLAVEANILVGGAARRNGDWETSGRAYSQAAYIADTLGDRQGVLKVQVGIANNYLAKGNHPHAQTILDDVIVQATDENFSEIKGLALHSRAALAQLRGQKAEAVSLTYEALSLTSSPAARDSVLEDLGVAFYEIGMRDAARDAHLILASTSQLKWVRSQALINLMELAGIDGMREAFDGYAAQLRKASLDSWLKSHFLLFLGEGLARFERYDAAEQAIDEAIAFASSNQIHAVAFRAEASLTEVRARARKAAPTPTFDPLPPEVLAAAHSIAELRKVALTSA
jgi:tetratricopeptide (TPR) repeat protein